MRPTWRRWVFRVATIGLGLLPFLVLEATLRLAGVAEDDWPQASKHLSAIDSDPWVDLHALRPLFTASSDGKTMEIGPDRMNFFCPAAFSIQKPDSTFRAFALGGSTTQGQPYRPDTAFAMWLQLRLQAAMPDRDCEVINAGGISYASYRVAAILDEVLAYRPDAIVLYMGQNEFLEARTYAAQARLPRPLALVVSKLAQWRITRLLRRAAQVQLGDKDRSPRMGSQDAPGVSGTRSPMRGEVDTILDQPNGLDAYRRDEAWSRGVVNHFALTFERMVLACQNAGVPLLVCVPASDLVNTPPFKSEVHPKLSPQQRAEVQRLAGVMNTADNSPKERLSAARAIARIDPTYAQARYHLGRWLYERGDATAKPHLMAARDHDVCPLRATADIEQRIRELTARHAVPVVDTPTLFDRTNAMGAAIPDGIPDPQRFVDHVHPTIGGHQAIAAAAFDVMRERGFFTTDLDGRQIESRYAESESEQLASLGEHYYGRAKQRLEGVKRWTGRP